VSAKIVHTAVRHRRSSEDGAVRAARIARNGTVRNRLPTRRRDPP
jgi:hypothetical protein